MKKKWRFFSPVLCAWLKTRNAPKPCVYSYEHAYLVRTYFCAGGLVDLFLSYCGTRYHSDREYKNNLESDMNIKRSLYSRSEWYEIVPQELLLLMPL